MIDQDLITRAKSIDIDFGGGKTLKGLLEDMEREVKVNARAFLQLCCDIQFADSQAELEVIRNYASALSRMGAYLDKAREDIKTEEGK